MSGNSSENRYSGVAVGLHWLIAALIIGMLGVGKWMTELTLEDPLRYELTQWHKSFGIAILLLSLFRLFWRKTHRPPPDTLPGPAWEKLAADITHKAFYVLFLLVPLTGWLMVSASKLKIPTLLFKTIPWPHLPWVGTTANSEQLAGLFHTLHGLTSNLLLLLLLLHIGAALRHHFILKDHTLSRMSLFSATGKLASGLIPFVLVIIVLSSAVLALNRLAPQSAPLVITKGDVTFAAMVMGGETKGIFQTAQVEVQLNPDDPANGTLNATVTTASLQIGDQQIQSTLMEADWFAVEQYPEARFVSTSFSQNESGGIDITGTLTIKETSREITFPASVEQSGAETWLNGGFTVNRLDYGIGVVDQPDDSVAGFNVNIEFSVEL